MNLRTPSTCAGLLALAALAQQDPGPGEVVVSSTFYLPPAPSKYQADTKLVEVGVVVRDPRGQSVAGLTKEDFEITDEGKRRQITAFSVETSSVASLPAAATPRSSDVQESPAAPKPAKVSQRYVALLFDDMSMDPGQLISAQAAALSFVKDGMREGDRVGLFTISEGQVVAFTTDASKLADAIAKIHFNLRVIPPDCPNLTQYEAYLIANQISLETFNVKIIEKSRCVNLPPQTVTSWVSTGPSAPTRSNRTGGDKGPNESMPEQVMSQATAVWGQVLAWSRTNLITIGRVVDLLGQMPGNRTMLLASSGFLSGTLEPEMELIIRDALHAGVVINSIDAKGLFTTSFQASDGAGGRLDGRDVINMQKIALPSKEAANDAVAALAYNTGGLFFHNRNDLDAGFRELGMRPDVSYLLAFTPEEAPNGRYHSLKVRLKNPGHNTVQARQGYMALKPAASRPPVERPVDLAATADTTIEDLPGDMAVHQLQTRTGEAGLMTVFHIDIKRLQFSEPAGVRQKKISLIAALTDAGGGFVTGKEGLVTLALKESTFNDYSPAGMNFTLTLVPPPGSYRLRVVMAESPEGKISARTLPVEIR